jgi:tRNA pseudouridine38-40 synthase
LEKMHAATQTLLGSHDFKPFQASGAAPMKTTVREILEAEVTAIPLDAAGFPLGVWDQIPGARFLRLRLVGTGFLKQMVRGIAGTLVQIGHGDQPISRIQEILDTQDRKKVGPTAPGRGLWLDRVWYSVEPL